MNRSPLKMIANQEWSQLPELARWQITLIVLESVVKKKYFPRFSVRYHWVGR